MSAPPVGEDIPIQPQVEPPVGITPINHNNDH